MIGLTTGTFATHRLTGRLARVAFTDGDNVVINLLEGSAIYDSQYLPVAEFSESYLVTTAAAEAPEPKFNDDTALNTAEIREAQKNFRDKHHQTDLFRDVVKEYDTPLKLQDFLGLSGTVKDYVNSVLEDLSSPSQGQMDAVAQMSETYATQLVAILSDYAVQKVEEALREPIPNEASAVPMGSRESDGQTIGRRDAFVQRVAQELSHYINPDTVHAWLVNKYYDSVNALSKKVRRQRRKLSREQAETEKQYEELHKETQVELTRLSDILQWVDDMLSVIDEVPTPLSDSAMLDSVCAPILAAALGSIRVSKEKKDALRAATPIQALQLLKSYEKLTMEEDPWFVSFRMDNPRLFILLADLPDVDNPADIFYWIINKLVSYTELPPELSLQATAALRDIAKRRDAPAQELTSALLRIRKCIQKMRDDNAADMAFYEKKYRLITNQLSAEDTAVKLPDSRMALISGQKVYDIAMGIWMQTEFLQGIAKPMLDATGVDLNQAGQSLLMQLPDEVYFVLSEGGKSLQIKNLSDKDFTVAGTIENPSITINPDIMQVKDAVLYDIETARKLRELLLSDPEAKKWLEKAGRFIPFSHRRYAQSINAAIAKASSPVEFINLIYHYGEMIKGSSTMSEADFSSTLVNPKKDRELHPSDYRYPESFSELAVFDHNKPGYAQFFSELRTAVLDALRVNDVKSAKKLLDGAPEVLAELDAKSSMVAQKIKDAEFIPIPDVKFKEPPRYLNRGIKEMEAVVRGATSASDSLAKQLRVQDRYSSLTGANMSNMIDASAFRQGQPVKLKDTAAVYVIVSRDDNNPLQYHLIPESSINSHDRVDLVTASVSDLVPLKVYRVDVGDVLEVGGSVAKVTDASSKDLGIVQATFKNLAEPVLLDLDKTDAAYELREPYKLVQCSRDGGWITPDDEINCPFHGANGHLSSVVAGFTPKKVIACKDSAVETQDPEIEKEFRHKYEVEKITAAMESISFDEVDPPETPYVDVAENFDGELEIGATVHKFGSTTLGTIVGYKKACLVVDWESGQSETVWPQEVTLVNVNADK